MSENVKVTKKQAEFIEEMSNNATNRDKCVECHINGWRPPELETLNKLTLDEFIRALYNKEYEVYQNFEIGDYVYNIYKDVVIYIDSEEMLVAANGIMNDRLRHATSYEIEKYRWNYYGRDFWELHVDDVLINPQTENVFKVIDLDESSVYLNDRGHDFDIEVIKNILTVLCFAEQRLDK